jgi:hypothetical protein
MKPWFIATEIFNSTNGDDWSRYIEWSGLTQLDELVSLDPMLCPTVLPEIKDSYWSHIVNENFTLNFFTDLDFLLNEILNIQKRNLLCVVRNPQQSTPPFHAGSVAFEFLGYDLIDVKGSASALTNCGGFPEVFVNNELSQQGLLSSHARALEVQAQLRTYYPNEHHADCHVWSIARVNASGIAP